MTLSMQQQKHNELSKLYAPYLDCHLCPLGSLGRSNVVFGEGNPNTAFMIIGEGPGAREDMEGLPFVGRSGKLLNQTLSSLGIERSDIFISNVVKCRPPENRRPTPHESKTCKQLLLLRQIAIIDPQVICTLGATALEGLIDKPVSMTKMRGQPLEWNGRLLLPTFHPAYILRNRTQLPIFTEDLARCIALSNQCS